MLFGKAIHQSTNHQTASVTVDRGLRREFGATATGCAASNELTIDGSTMALRKRTSAMARMEAGINIRRSEGHQMNNDLASTYPTNLAYLFGKICQSVEELERNSNEPDKNRVANLVLIPTTGSITTRESSCSGFRNKSWRDVPFIHNLNRLTCQWHLPSI